MKIFITDNTSKCFFTAVYYAFAEKNCLITSDSALQPTFDDEIKLVETDEEKVARVIKKINSYDNSAAESINLILKSGDARKEQTAFEFIKKLIEYKRPIGTAYNLTEVVLFNELIYKITGEIHRIKGLLRFTECADGTLYAPYSPDNDITENLMPHFSARLGGQKFIIHDLKRKKAGICNGAEWIIYFADQAEIKLSENQKIFETLWKKYYKTINIEFRPHEKQMKNSMPVRYWKFLPEKHDL